MSFLDTAHVDLYERSTNTSPLEVLTLSQALDRVQGTLYRSTILDLRDVLTDGNTTRYDKGKDQLEALTLCGTFSPTRAKKNLVQHNGIVHGDLDHLNDIHVAKQALCADPHTVYCFISPSGKGLKVGVHVESATDDAAYTHAWHAVANYHQQRYSVTWDPTGKDVSRLCYVSHDAELYRNPDAMLFAVPPQGPPQPKPRPFRPAADIPRDVRERYDQRAIQTAVDIIDASTPGNRHAARLKAGTLLGGYAAGGILSYSEAYSALETAVERNTEDFARSMRTIRDALEHGQAEPISLEDLEAETQAWRAQHQHQRTHRPTPDMSAPPPTGTPNGTGPPVPPQDHASTAEAEPSLPWSDTTNALALVRAHGHDLRYCWPWKKWLVWTGSHWKSDDTGAVRQKAKQTIKRLARHAEALEDQEARALMAHVKRSLSTAAIKAMIESAQDEPRIPVQPEALDADPWVLNCANGTLDLHTGMLRPHTRADLLTKCLPIDYDPQAPCPTWERFLWRIMGGTTTPDDPDMSASELEQRHTADERAQALISFLQRAVGYTLTGSTREQCLFILHGVTKTGKSTLLATLRALLGPYGQQADMQSFLHKDREEVRNDLADLAGSRFVCALESQEGKRLAESLIKQLTGGTDHIKARFLFQEYFTFKPQFKIFLGTNHKPVIRDTDSAIWERIRLIPFAVQIPVAERDKTLDERLQHELPGILAWAVRGCLEWQRLGELREPEAVEQATQGYRNEMDDIGRFLTEVCLLQADYKTQASRLLKAYQQWSGQTTETSKSFVAKLSGRGYESKRFTTGNFWLGIGLSAEATEG